MSKPATPQYSAHPVLRKRFDRVAGAMRFTGSGPREAKVWRSRLRRRLKQLIGLNAMQSCALKPRITERTDCGEYFRERIELQTEPGVVMPVFALIPKAARPPYPVVLCPHGHGGGGKAAVAGVTDEPKIAEAIPNYRYDYGVQFCRAGFVALCPDARGFGERREALSQGDTLASSCQWINHMALPLGLTVTGMWVWDLQRLIDYAQTREDCNATRLGCAGLSGGGLQTLWLTALDDRVKAAVVSGYFYGVKESLLDMYGNCSCNYVPHLWEYADHGDLGGLLAPRPALIQTGRQDSLNGVSGLKNVRTQLRITRRVYEAHGAPGNLRHDVFDGPHRWDNTNAIPFMVRHLMGA
jgi:dienelactone hydrolase